jgi:hypothetical protein
MNINTILSRAKKAPILSQVVGLIPPPIKSSIRGMVDRATAPSTVERVLAQTSQTNDLLARMVYEQAFTTARFQEEKRLLRHGFKVYSQHDEDGIIEEVFNRIGVTDRFFVEFGIGDGLENCTTYCLLKGWSGVWIDGSAACYQGILKNLDFLIAQKRLRARYGFITAENIESLFQEMEVPAEFDFLSIDIDLNDYWVWKAIRRFRPRVVAIEYNASFKQTVACTVPYDGSASWDTWSNYYGSSLKALEYLGAEKGYRLVGCNYTGVTAFFVREDCAGDHFAAPYTSENHYEPPRYFTRMPNGHGPAFGPVVTVTAPGQ